MVDASVAVKWFVPEPGSSDAEAILAGGVALAAPEHLLAEVAQALFRHRRRGDVALTQIRASLHKLEQWVSLRPTSWFVEQAVDVAETCQCSIYDAIYVAAAERWTCRVVTADARLTRSLAGTRWADRATLLSFSETGSP